MKKSTDSDYTLLKIHYILNSLGVSARYTGFRLAVSAISLALNDPELLKLISKNLYPVLAKRYHTTVKCIERNIRTIIDKAWQNNPSLLSSLAGYTLLDKPKTGQFIEIVVSYLRKTE